MSSQLYKKYNTALEHFLELYSKKNNISAILVIGSFVRGKLSKHSDLDVYLIVNNGKKRERGIIWIDGIEVEYFINPIKQIKKYLAQENKSNEQATADILVNGKIIYQKGNKINQLITEAREIKKRKKKPLSKYTIETYKYHLNDIKKSLKEADFIKDNFVFNLLRNKIAFLALDIFFKVNHLSNDKPKYLKKILVNTDKKFFNIFTKAIDVNSGSKLHNQLKLIDYTEKMIGGKRGKNWQLKSDCDF